MVDILARVIADSIGDHAPRLFTVETRYPKFVHQESLRHRLIYIEDALRGDPDFSFSVSSSRAIPFSKMVMEARSKELRATPVSWGRAQKGMSPGDELDDTEKCIYLPEVLGSLGLGWSVEAEFITKKECCRFLWDLSADLAARAASAMNDYCDLHKSIVNRVIEPYIHVNVLMTGTQTGWLNFFGLRLDKAADPTLRALAEVCWREWNESQPRKLAVGEWHLPYTDDEQSLQEALDYGSSLIDDGLQLIEQFTRQMSVARCAHLSYQSFETGERMTVGQCVTLYNRFMNSVPLHASPFEHQARADNYQMMNTFEDARNLQPFFMHPELSGNLGLGWIQLRKTLPGESLAPLPEGYR